MKLTPEQLRQIALAMIAFADGKPIQFRFLDRPQDRWIDNETPSWDCDQLEYRPKPEPVSRPWSKPEDVPGPVCWVRLNNGRGAEQFITFIGSHKITFGGTCMDWSILKDYEHSTDRINWKKCEVME